MKRLLLTLCFLLHILFTLAQNADKQKSRAFKLPEGISTKDYVPGVVIVKFKAVGSSPKTLSVVPPSVLKSKNIISAKRKFGGPESSITTSARRRDKVGLDRIYELRITNSASIETVINQLLSDPQVEYAEPRYINHISYVPNDPLFPQQPYLQQVMAPQAWDLIRNIPSVIIGIVDSGSELAHPDLAANIYYNAADPANGIDDDGNGKVDDYRGWDFAGPTGNTEDNDPNVVGPANDHGVHVSGIASAVTDNGIGVSSVAFNTAKLLIVKAGPDNSGSDILYGYEGIKYAADQGAHIINCSWGSSEGGNFGRDVVAYAISKGSLIVAAGGNSGVNDFEYPAAYKGVLGVANIESDDAKAGSSNFGTYISVAAPGGSILSTTFGGNYGPSSGTSMSAPIVSAAAALVKAYRPVLDMQQVREMIRVTADDISDRNTAYDWQLGKGKVNVFRALTENPPAVRIFNTTSEERKSGNIVEPDTLYLYLDLKNFLFPVAGLKLTLSTTNPNVTVLTPQITIPSIGASEILLARQPFKIAVSPSTPSNTQVAFRLNYDSDDNSYHDFEHLSVIVARDYIDIHNGTISTTISSNGRIGFSAPDESGGLGFLYKGERLLFEAALMVGVSPAKVSNNVRSEGEETDEHFLKRVAAHEVVNNADSVVVEAEFDDRGSPNPLNIVVNHQMTAYKQAPDDKYVIAEYEIFNSTNFELRNVHVGLFTDWDILGGSKNVTQYDPSERLAYTYHKQQAAPYGAVKLLSRNAPPIYCPLSYELTGNPLSDSELTIAEKWETLTQGVKALSLGTTTSGVDVSFVSGNGPYTIPANGSIKVSFALIGGDNLQDIKESALAAQQKFNLSDDPGGEQVVTEFNILAYPNPVFAAIDGASTIRFTLPEAGRVSLDLFDILGQRVRTLIANQSYSSGVHYFKYDFSDGYFSDVRTGVYFYRLRFNNQYKTSKISVLK